MKFDTLVDPIDLINNYNCIFIYGLEELAYSFFNEFDGVIVESNDLSNINFLQTSLIPEPNIKVKIDAKNIKNILKQDIQRWNRKCIILTSKEVNDNKVAEINCDIFNVKNFLMFHTKRLGYSFDNMEDLLWVKDLSDLHFAYKISQIDKSCMKNLSSQEINQTNLLKKNNKESLEKLWQLMENPWSWIRYMQFFYKYRNNNVLVAMYKHLELWAHKHAPNDEVLIWLCRSIMLRDSS